MEEVQLSRYASQSLLMQLWRGVGGFGRNPSWLDHKSLLPVFFVNANEILNSLNLRLETQTIIRVKIT